MEKLAESKTDQKRVLVLTQAPIYQDADGDVDVDGDEDDDAATSGAILPVRGSWSTDASGVRLTTQRLDNVYDNDEYA